MIEIELREELDEARIALVVADYYGDLAEDLIAGASSALVDAGVDDDDIILVRVPGCWELPLAVQHLIEDGEMDAVIALGVVIRGETPHFDFVAGECARSLAALQLGAGLPVSFGVLTCDDYEQAEDRADPDGRDKGGEAARAALRLLDLARYLEEDDEQD